MKKTRYWVGTLILVLGTVLLIIGCGLALLFLGFEVNNLTQA